MAKKKKVSEVTGSELRQAVEGMEKAVKELSLNIKTLTKAMGHTFKGGGLPPGHPFTK